MNAATKKATIKQERGVVCFVFTIILTIVIALHCFINRRHQAKHDLAVCCY